MSSEQVLNPRRRMKHCHRARRRLRDSGQREVFWADEGDAVIPGSDDEDSEEEESWDRDARGLHKKSLAGKLNGGNLRALKQGRVPLPSLDALKRSNPGCNVHVFPKWLGNPVRDGRLLTDKYVNLDHFGKIKFLIEGETSVVSLARYEPNQRYYCLKGIKKSWVYKTRSFSQVERQLGLHISTSSRFIANVFRVFDHPSFVFVMQEYCLGGTLDMLVKRRSLGPFKLGKLTFDEARFYLAQIASALHYLHSIRNVIYRNLALENVGISWNGHVKLLGFGRAVEVPDPDVPFIRTTDDEEVGPMSAVAPELVPPRLIDPFKEMCDEDRELRRLQRAEDAAAEAAEAAEEQGIDDGDCDGEREAEESKLGTGDDRGPGASKNNGLLEEAEEDNYEEDDIPDDDDLHLFHSYGSDWWAFGVMLFEMLNGYLPFGNSHFESDSDVARRILFGRKIKPFWGSKRKDRACSKAGYTELLNGLLQIDQDDRWGFIEVTESRFFQGAVEDWMLVHQMKPPWVPPLGQVEADSSVYAKPQRARQKQLKIGEFPEELKAKPSKHEISYTYFAAVCRDVMLDNLSSHTLRSRQQVEARALTNPRTAVGLGDGLPESQMFQKLQRGYARLEEKRKYQRDVAVQQARLALANDKKT